ncbi:Uncharacterised protein [uncultured archaeon]|nr:Uncharacterised protein [uncultured archaeon]
MPSEKKPEINSREDVKISMCFYRSKNGKCGSMEIYRKQPGMDTGDPCPFDANACAFIIDGTDDRMGNLRCQEFCPKYNDRHAT